MNNFQQRRPYSVFRKFSFVCRYIVWTFHDFLKLNVWYLFFRFEYCKDKTFILTTVAWLRPLAERFYLGTKQKTSTHQKRAPNESKLRSCQSLSRLVFDQTLGLTSKKEFSIAIFTTCNNAHCPAFTSFYGTSRINLVTTMTVPSTKPENVYLIKSDFVEVNFTSQFWPKLLVDFFALIVDEW